MAIGAAATAKVMSMMKRLLLTALLVSIGPSAAWAQCAPGVPCAGNPMGIPPDQPNSPYQTPDGDVRSQPAWIKTWGAIAIDNGGTAASAGMTGYDDRSSAVSAAIHKCEQRGGTDCRLRIAFHNQCAAVSWGERGGYGVAGAATSTLAEADAAVLCQKYGKGQCKIVYSDCSRPRQGR